MKIDYAIIGFLCFVGRITIYGASIGEAIALFALAGLCGAKHWIEQQKVKDVNAEFEENVKIEFERANQEITGVKNALGALNLGMAQRNPFRTGNGQLQK